MARAKDRWRGMTFNIVTFYDYRLAVIGDLTSAVAERYAEENRYRFCKYRFVMDEGIHIFWNKVSILLKEIEHADYTMWLDAEALVVGNNKLENVVTPF